MSHAAMEGVAAPSTSVDEPCFGGLSLSLYIAVGVARSEGFPLDEVLQHFALPESDWERAEDAWAEALAADARRQPPHLQDAYAAGWLQEVKRYARRIEPLSSDLEAWCGFFCAWLGAEDPAAFLAGYELSPADVGRLQAHWSACFASQPALLERHSYLLSTPPAPPLRLDAPPPAMPPPRPSYRATDE